MIRLEGRRALITGGGRGIGKAIAIRLAELGADVAVNYAHSEDEAEETAGTIRALGRRAAVFKANIGEVEEVRQLVDESERFLGGLDVLINNAGIEKQAPFLEVSEKDYDAVLAINLKGVFFASQFFARMLVAAGRPGSIVSISSVHEELPFPGYAAYAASKGGMKLLTRDMAVELAPHDIRVNAVAPGAIRTEINSYLVDDPNRGEKLLRQIPLRRIGEPKDVANVVAFLVSEQASYVSGSTYFVDGGLTWHYEE